MGPKELFAKLKKIEPRLRVAWSPNKVSGLYFFQPRHPDSRRNWRHIGAIASASWFYSLPKKDFYTRGDKVCLGGVPAGADLVQWEYHRGWKSTVRLLGEMGHISKYKLAKVFGWDVFVLGDTGTLKQLPGWGELTKGQKAKKALGMDYTHAPQIGPATVAKRYETVSA